MPPPKGHPLDQLLISIAREVPLPAVARALKMIALYGGTDGEHHKDWVIDQVARQLAGNRYAELVAAACAGEDGPETYEWEIGVAP